MGFWQALVQNRLVPSVTVFSEDIPNYNAFEFAVMYFQITVTDKNQNTRAAVSDVIKEITLQICQ